MKTKTNLSFLILIAILHLSSDLIAQSDRVWGSYFGGSSDEYNQAIASDASGNVYIAGFTSSTSGIAFGGFQNSNAGGTDAYLAKIDNDGNLIWSTYFGGSSEDYAKGVVVDTSGDVYLSGTTSSTSGIASGGMQNIYGGGVDAFLAKFDATGTLLWATYVGGDGYDEGFGLGKDNLGNIFLTGITTSTSNIAVSGFNNSYSGGNSDAYLIKFDESGNVLWGTYYGDAGDDWGWSIASDAANNVYLSGATSSSSGIASGGFQNTLSPGPGFDDAFLVKFDASGSRLWATYYGDNGNEEGTGVCTDPSGDVYLFGLTSSISGLSASGFQNSYGGGDSDLFLVKFDSSGSRLWATYYGGSNMEESGNVVSDSSGYIYIAGDTYSTEGIASGGYQNNLIGLENQLVAKFNSDGNLLCATYYGQVHDEIGTVAADNFGNIFLSGITMGTTGIASGGFQNSYAGGLFDAYVVKLNTCDNSDIEKVSGDEIKIYPNPCTEKIFLSGNEFSDIKNAEITDVLGRNLIVSIQDNYIDVSELKEGIYYLTVQGNESFYKIKFIKSYSH